MKRRKIKNISSTAYIAVLILFSLFFFYMLFFENVSIKMDHEPHFNEIVQDIEIKNIKDSSAPAGLRQEYTFSLDNIHPGDYLSLYLVHQYAEIYIEKDIVYSLAPDQNSHSGKSPGCNMVSLPLSEIDTGKEIRAVVTPAYETFSNRKVTFLLAPPDYLLHTLLQRDLPKLIIGGLCLVLGAMMMILQIVLIIRKKSKSKDMFYLGNFIFLLGIWKFFDVPLIALLFENNTKAVSYISIGSMFISVIPMAMHIREHTPYHSRRRMTITILFSSASAVAALAMQVFNVLDFRELLAFFHIVILLNAAIILSIFISSINKKPFRHFKMVFIFTIPFAIALTADLVTFYVSDGMASVTYTVIMLLIYSIAVYLRNMIDVSKKAFIDVHTGLYNKNYWDALLYENWNCDVAGIIVIDINNLKHVNDTLGHDAGDKLISDFSKLISKVIQPPNVVCRWGGDEFTCLVRNATKSSIEDACKRLLDLVEAYNRTYKNDIKIHYALGYVLTSEFPNQTRQALVHEADSRMYENKRKWYEENKSRSL